MTTEFGCQFLRPWIKQITLLQITETQKDQNYPIFCLVSELWFG